MLAEIAKEQMPLDVIFARIRYSWFLFRFVKFLRHVLQNSGSIYSDKFMETMYGT